MICLYVCIYLFIFTSVFICIVKATPVNLTCDIQGGNIQWTYSWFKEGYTHNPFRTTTTSELRFSTEEFGSGEYSCEAKRSDTSAAVTLTESGD